MATNIATIQPKYESLGIGKRFSLSGRSLSFGGIVGFLSSAGTAIFLHYQHLMIGSLDQVKDRFYKRIFYEKEIVF